MVHAFLVKIVEQETNVYSTLDARGQQRLWWRRGTSRGKRPRPRTYCRHQSPRPSYRKREESRSRLRNFTSISPPSPFTCRRQGHSSPPLHGISGTSSNGSGCRTRRYELHPICRRNGITIAETAASRHPQQCRQRCANSGDAYVRPARHSRFGRTEQEHKIGHYGRAPLVQSAC